MWKEGRGRMMVNAACARLAAGLFDSKFNLRNHPWEKNRKMLNKWRRGRVRRSPISPPGLCSCLTGGVREGGDGISIFHPTTPHDAQVHGRAPSSGVLSTPASGRISTVALSPSAMLSMSLQYNCSTGKEGRLPLLYILTFHPKSRFVIRPVYEAPQ